MEELTKKKCRELQAKGYSDYELYCLGFDKTTIEKSFVRAKKQTQSKRCRTCGAKYFFLPENRVCLRCKLEAGEKQ